MSPHVKKFFATVAQLAGQIPGMPPVLIVVRDPETRVVSFVGTPGALENMKPEIIEKVKPQQEENVGHTGWEG